MRTSHKTTLRNSPIKTWAEQNHQDRCSILIAVAQPTMYAALPLPYLPKNVRNSVLLALFHSVN